MSSVGVHKLLVKYQETEASARRAGSGRPRKVTGTIKTTRSTVKRETENPTRACASYTVRFHFVASFSSYCLISALVSCRIVYLFKHFGFVFRPCSVFVQRKRNVNFFGPYCSLLEMSLLSFVRTSLIWSPSHSTFPLTKLSRPISTNLACTSNIVSSLCNPHTIMLYRAGYDSQQGLSQSSGEDRVSCCCHRECALNRIQRRIQRLRK